MLLYGKPVVESLFHQTKERVQTKAPQGAYIVLLLFSDDYASTVYVRNKKAYAKRCGLMAVIEHHPHASKEEAIQLIHSFAQDKKCIGIVVQLPLAPHLKPYQPEILATVPLAKDPDGLSGEMFGRSLTEVVNFLPATPKATFALLDYYQLGDLQGKVVTMIGQSNLMGKPFVLEAMRRGATVVTTNAKTPVSLLQDACLKSDYIVSATGVVELLTPSFFNHTDLTGKIIIDVGYGIKDGHACGDSDRRGLEKLGATITPVPGGVGPVTVACLLHNILVLDTIV